MLRMILGIVAGLVVGMGLVYGLQMLGHTIWPLPEGIDTRDPAQLRDLVARMPPIAVAWVAVAYGIAAFGGASLANWIAQGRIAAGWVVTAALFGLTVWTLFMIPHPLWFVGLAVALYLAAGVGARALFGRRA
ncbi:MAG TPA: hypothetical protein VEA44_05460 [Caulobacter sp.]|nr:hypothetical protein [Caulobacter sp.]